MAKTPSQEVESFADLAKRHLERITIILTNRCNFNCEYCISKPGRNGPQDLATEDAEKAIDFAKGKGITIRFTGGEPSQHKDFYKLVLRAVRTGLPVEVLTNGSFIPADPKEFARAMEPLLVRSWMSGRVFPSNLQFQLSLDPVHFERDLLLKDRLFLLAKLIQEKGSLLTSVSRSLRINVRGNFSSKVSAILYSPGNLRPETIKAFGGRKVLEDWLKEADYHGFFRINPAESIVRVAGARKYVPSAKMNKAKVREFDVYKEVMAGFVGTDIAINPNGNAFASVYSAYENMHSTTFTPSGKHHPRPFRVTLLGNVHEKGMQFIVGKLMRRATRWKNFERSGLFGYGEWSTRDLLDRRRRQGLKRTYAEHLTEQRRARQLAEQHKRR